MTFLLSPTVSSARLLLLLGTTGYSILREDREGKVVVVILFHYKFCCVVLVSRVRKGSKTGKRGTKR
jgi:hypothetical protein